MVPLKTKSMCPRTDVKMNPRHIADVFNQLVEEQHAGQDCSWCLKIVVYHNSTSRRLMWLQHNHGHRHHCQSHTSICRGLSALPFPKVVHLCTGTDRAVGELTPQRQTSTNRARKLEHNVPSCLSEVHSTGFPSRIELQLFMAQICLLDHPFWTFL